MRLQFARYRSFKEGFSLFLKRCLKRIIVSNAICRLLMATTHQALFLCAPRHTVGTTNQACVRSTAQFLYYLRLFEYL